VPIVLACEEGGGRDVLVMVGGNRKRSRGLVLCPCIIT
jgi:hypothetical protein